jgi:site-specific DNA-methyltransferase (cytosine-N4-specific)
MLFQLTPSFNTALGSAYLGEALELLKFVSSNSINLIISSPPFALYSKEIYGYRYVT